ncbi:MAG TPA: NYN domain-containing protein, partial [Candidatus Eisenbacteria bacterium]
MADNENSLAVFVDFENLALGFEGRRGPRFEIQKVLERLVEKGKIIVKRAYADWGRFREYRSGLHEAAIELIEIPRRSMTGKNSADIRLVVDAMDLSYSKAHVDTFVIISGDSDFSPLVSKLKENGKQVIGIGMKSSTSDLLVDNCDEFIFYEDLDRPAISVNTAEMGSVPTEKKKLFSLVMEALAALRRENKEVIWSSMVKDTIKRKRPQFNETYYGYRSFSNVLEDAQRFGLVSLTTDPRSGTYVVS